jgi:acetate kinase
LAPLHQPHNLAAIRAIARQAPELPQVACFDTSFHRTQPSVAQQFALPRDLTATGIQRYGFHGLSYEYIASRLPQFNAHAAAGRTVVAHLGNGASLCAL